MGKIKDEDLIDEIVYDTDGNPIGFSAIVKHSDLIAVDEPMYYDRKGCPVDKFALFRVHHSKLDKKFANRPRPNGCESCGDPCKHGKELVFDHCHATGNFRGWLCSGCNKALGFCEDSQSRLRALADYQERFQGPEPPRETRQSSNYSVAARITREEKNYMRLKAAFEARLAKEPAPPPKPWLRIVDHD